MFKTATAIASSALALALMAAAPQLSAAPFELAINGGFETGDFTGWNQFPNGGTQTVSTIDPASGTYSANLVSDLPAYSLIRNANIGIGTVSAGEAISVSFKMRGTTTNGGVAFAELFSELAGGGVSSAEILGGSPLFGSTDWTSYQFSSIAGPDVSGGITFQVGAICGALSGCLSDVFVDDVSVTVDRAPVPAPSALWLMILGAIGFLAARHQGSS